MLPHALLVSILLSLYAGVVHSLRINGWYNCSIYSNSKTPSTSDHTSAFAHASSEMNSLLDASSEQLNAQKLLKYLKTQSAGSTNGGPPKLSLIQHAWLHEELQRYAHSGRQAKQAKTTRHLGEEAAEVEPSPHTQCAHITVPLCHSSVCTDPRRRNIDIFVKRIPAIFPKANGTMPQSTEPPSPPKALWLLQGGPGDSSVELEVGMWTLHRCPPPSPPPPLLSLSLSLSFHPPTFRSCLSHHHHTSAFT